MADANIRAVITAQDKASSVIGGVGTSFGKLVGGVAAGQLAFQAANFAYSQLTSAIGGSLKAFETQQLAVTRLQTGINNVKTATDKHIDALTKQALALQKTTRFSDEATISAQGILSTFQLNQDAIGKLTPRLLDMSEGLARVTGEMPDLEGNAILVAKALGGEDVTGLVGALRRVGVVMTAHQQELLKTADFETRLSIITQVLDQNFKGMAESAGGTTAGKIAILKNNFNELQESVGKLMATALNPLLELLNKYPAILTATVIGITALTAAFIAVKVAAGISTIFTALGGAISFVGATATATAGAFSGMLAVLASPVTLVIAGAIADLVLLLKAIQAVVGAYQAIKDNQTAIANSKASIANAHDQLLQLSKTGTAQQKASANKALAAGYASGTDYAPGGMAIVGEQGPELINLPRGSQVIPNNKISGMGGNINVTFNGVFTGNQQEFRKLAVNVFKAYEDAKGMGTT